MSKAPYAISALVALAGLAWAVHLALDPDPFAGSAAFVIAAGVVVFTIIAVVGMLLVRAPWGRWIAFATLGVGLGIGIITGLDDAGALVAAILSLLAVGGLSGPWLRVWLRQRPSATAPEPKAALLPLASLALLPLTGFVSPEGLSPALAVLAASGPAFAAGYARAGGWALWGLRLALPVLTIWAAVGLTTAGAVVLVGAGGGVTWLAWTPSARRAIRRPGPPLPAPRRKPNPSAAEPG